MKAVFSALLAAAAFAATPAFADRVCLDMKDIVSTHSDDGKVLVFKMRDGRTLYNHLQGRCPDLKFNGFVWVSHGPQNVCEGMQSLRVIQSGETCVLGKFGPPGMSTDSRKSG